MRDGFYKALAKCEGKTQAEALKILYYEGYNDGRSSTVKEYESQRCIESEKAEAEQDA